MKADISYLLCPGSVYSDCLPVELSTIIGSVVCVHFSTSIYKIMTIDHTILSMNV